MASLQPVRGTRDLWPDEARRHRYVEDTAFRIAKLYGFGEIMTPIFEFTEVFARTLGETSDVVTKEMYTFTDRSGESLTLRPEATAGIARAFINEGQSLPRPIKLFYRGPMFRHERPQKGRLRQFHQIDAEILGSDRPQADIELIAMAWRLLGELGLQSKVTLELNSLGSKQDRLDYRNDLQIYLTGRVSELSPESKDRLLKNPLRILDSKDEGDRRVLADAPLMSNRLKEGRGFFDNVQEGLTALGIPFTISPRLVRGLDYYCHTVFEFTTAELGAQGTVLAGGRYDGLIQEMGGPPTHGVGWAAGVERLAAFSGPLQSQIRPIIVVSVADPIGPIKIAENIRSWGHVVEFDYSGKPKRALERARILNACAVIFLGLEEASKGVAAVRDLDLNVQEDVAFDALQEYLTSRFSQSRAT